MRALGIDGCPSGWVCVWIDPDGNRGWQIIETIDSITLLRAKFALIDIPIGLPESGTRVCDLVARQILGPSRSRVFLHVRRGLLNFQSYEEANAWGKKNGKGVMRQTFCIVPKIRQVDDFVLKNGQTFLKETHPELIFQRLKGGKSLKRKKSREGKHDRIEILLKNGFSEIEFWLSKLPRKKAGADDLLDACACAIAASDYLVGKARRVPNDDYKCGRGLLMEMWY